MSSVKDYYLDEQKLVEGVRLPLRDKANRLTEDWLQVRYAYSDSYHAAVTAAMRADYVTGEPVPETETERRFRHLLVTAWSFDEECTPEEVKAFFGRNPRVAAAVVDTSMRTSLFFPDTAEPSSTGPDGNSNYSSDQPRPPTKNRKT
jgi:hypothetical protein